MDKISLARDIKFGENEIKAITINMSSGSIGGDNRLINRLIKVNDRLKPADTDIEAILKEPRVTETRVGGIN